MAEFVITNGRGKLYADPNEDRGAQLFYDTEIGEVLQELAEQAGAPLKEFAAQCRVREVASMDLTARFLLDDAPVPAAEKQAEGMTGGDDFGFFAGLALLLVVMVGMAAVLAPHAR